MTKATSLAVSVPWSSRLTAYDEAHFAVYLRLLDAKAGGVSEDAMLQIIRDADPAMTAGDAQCALASHLARALWMSEVGYRDLLSKED